MHQDMVKALRRGDTVVTNGGLVGKVTKVVDDDQIEVEISDGVRVRQMRLHGERGACQGRAGQGRQRELIAPRSQQGISNSMLFFHAVEGGGYPDHGAGRVHVRRAEFLRRKHGAALADLGAAPHRARSRPARRLPSPARGRFQRRAQRAIAVGGGRRVARYCAKRAFRSPAGPFAATASRSTSRATPTLTPRSGKLRELSQPMGRHPRHDGTAQYRRYQQCRPHHAYAERTRHHRAGSPGGRSILQIIERRVNELGLVEPTIQREGINRILVQVPGLQDPSRLKEILGKDREARFRMVDPSMTVEQAAGRPSLGFGNTRRRGRPALLIEKAGAGVRRRISPTPSRASTSAAMSRSSVSVSIRQAPANSPKRRRRMSASRSLSYWTIR